VQKSLKNGFAVASHHMEEEIPGGLPATMAAHSASKSGPNSGSDKMETLSFQYDLGAGGGGGPAAKTPLKEAQRAEWSEVVATCHTDTASLKRVGGI
jgi:hypothetical protein